MTKQTIDGISRDLLDLLYRALNGGDNQLTGMEHGRAFRELRALLDAPVECRCKRYGKDNPHWPCPVHAAPAAQPQGEPVARILKHGPAFKGICGVAQARTYEEFPRRCVDESDGYWVEGPPLYAEQPAPVAVVLPARPHSSEEDQQSMTEYEIGLGHGACEMWDKIKKLNSGDKP